MFRLILWILILFIVYRLLASVILPWLVQIYIGRAKRQYTTRQEGGRRIQMEDGKGEIILPEPSQRKTTSAPADLGIEDTPYEEL